MVLSHERAFAARLAVYIARAGRQAAQDHADGIDDPNLEDFAEALGNLLRPSMLTVARAFANRIRQSPKAAHAFEHKAFEELDAALAEYVRTRSATRVTQITESLQRSIANIIRHGLTHRLSTEEVAANIVAATEGEMATARARRIAVTEMHSAANAGAYEAARQSGLEYVKEWVATEDNRTRPDHAEAHGQRVALEDTFLVGDAELQYPGDPDGPPEQIINCRCTVLYDPILEGADPRITRESEAYAGSKQPAEQQDQPQAILPAELLKELESFWRIMRETHTAVDTLEGYVDALLLGLTDKQATIESYVGGELPLEFRDFLLDPRPIGVDYPPQDTFRGVGVIVKLTVPQGTPIDPVGPKPAVGGRIALRSDFDYSALVTGVSVETWGGVLDDAGFDDELPPKVPGETRREREMRQDRARFVRRRRATTVIVISATLTATPRG